MLFPTSISLPLVEMVCFCGPSPLLESSRGTFKNTGSLAPWQAQEMQTVVCKLWVRTESQAVHTLEVGRAGTAG